MSHYAVCRREGAEMDDEDASLYVEFYVRSEDRDDFEFWWDVYCGLSERFDALAPRRG